jgi:hypothetical protein
VRRSGDIGAVTQLVTAAPEQISRERQKNNAVGIAHATVQWEGSANRFLEDLLVGNNHVSG